MKKFIAIIAAFAALSFNATAHDNDNKTYHTNGVLDNLFVSAGAGVNGILDNGSFTMSAPALDLAFGKWFTPSVGARIGYHGLSNKAVDTANGWFAGENAFGFHYIHADFLWNFTNTIFGYRDSRFFGASAYYHAGMITTTYNEFMNHELGTGLGLILKFRITSWLDANIDAMANMSREEAWRDAGKVICFPSVTAGITANFGRKTNKFERHEDKVMNIIIPGPVRECDHDKKIAALEAERDSLLKLQPKTVIKKKYINNGMVTYFTIDKWDLSQREKFHLMDLVKNIPADAVLTIVGHADKETGSHARNVRLSNERVRVVENALRELGFAGEIKSDAKGDNANPFTGIAPKNRCVTISVSVK